MESLDDEQIEPSVEKQRFPPDFRYECDGDWLEVCDFGEQQTDNIRRFADLLSSNRLSAAGLCISGKINNSLMYGYFHQSKKSF
jgi:hypothetical protein